MPTIPRVEMQRSVGIAKLTELDPPRGRSAARFVAYMTTYPIVVAGFGGWSRVARPRRRAMTEWVGRDSISIQWSFLVDVLDENRGGWAEANIRSLELFGGIGMGDNQPPLLRVDSVPKALFPYGHFHGPGTRWFVDQLSWDADSIIVNDGGDRVRAGGSVTITQWIADERISPAERRRHDRNKGDDSENGRSGGGHRKTYVVKAGDTLSEIAARKDVYGDSSKWKKIATANKIRDPKKLKTGQHLRIP